MDVVDGVNPYLLGTNFQSVYHIILRIACLATFLTQAALIDYYLIKFNSAWWYFWIVPDLIVFGMFLGSVTLTFLRLKPRKPCTHPPSKLKRLFGDQPFLYVTWFVYAGFLAAKICILFKVPYGVALRLVETDFFGPNMLKTAVCLSSIVFYLFVLSSHDAVSHSPQNAFVTVIAGSLYLDLLDSTQFLDIQLQEPQAVHNLPLHYIILTIVTFNFLIPTEALIILCRTEFGKFPYSRRFQFLHKIFFMIMMNGPLFTIRLTVWHLQDHSVSVFLIKNIIVMGMAVRDIHEFIIDVSDTFGVGAELRRITDPPIEEHKINPTGEPYYVSPTGEPHNMKPADETTITLLDKSSKNSADERFKSV